MTNVLLRSTFSDLSRLWSRRSVISTVSRGAHSYEGDGKTTVTILNQESDSPLMVNGFSKTGFRLNNGMSVIGPLALFPKSAMGWDVNNVTDITPESLTAFTIVEPKPDILIIGIGDPGPQVSPDTQKYIRSKGIRLEILSTEHACTTFNFLNCERRYVTAALIPPKTKRLRPHEESFQAKMKKKLEDELDT